MEVFSVLYISGLLTSQHVWMGIRRPDTESNFTHWISGENINFSFWDSGRRTKRRRGGKRVGRGFEEDVKEKKEETNIRHYTLTAFL